MSTRTDLNKHMVLDLKAVDTIGYYSKKIISIEPYLVTSNGERLIV